MNILKPVLEKFLKAAKMDGVSSVNECILDFKEDGLHVEALTGATSVFMKGFLPKATFDAYEAIGEVPLNNLCDFFTIVSRFSNTENIKLEMQAPFLVLEGAKTFKVKVAHRDTIEDLTSFPEVTGDNLLTLSKSQLDDFLNDVKAVGAEIFSINIFPKLAVFSAKETHECSARFNGDMLRDNIKLNFGPIFVNALSGIEGDMEFTFVRSNYPIKIQYKTDAYNFVYIIAPSMADEEEPISEEGVERVMNKAVEQVKEVL